MKLITKNENQKISSYALAAKNIKRELADKFPGQKFSVKSSSFSMGDHVRIDWIDGPTTEEVELTVKKYEYGTFDGMTDTSGTKPTFENGLYGDSKYVMCQREISPEIRAKAIQDYREKFGVKYDEHKFEHYAEVNSQISNTSYYRTEKKEQTGQETKRLPKNEYFILKYWYCLAKGWPSKSKYFSERLARMGIDTRQLCKMMTDEQIENKLESLNRA